MIPQISTPTVSWSKICQTFVYWKMFGHRKIFQFFIDWDFFFLWFSKSGSSHLKKNLELIRASTELNHALLKISVTRLHTKIARLPQFHHCQVFAHLPITGCIYKLQNIGCWLETGAGVCTSALIFVMTGASVQVRSRVSSQQRVSF